MRQFGRHKESVMVLERVISEFGVRITCDGSTLRVVGAQGGVVEERPVAALTYVEISEEVGRAEEELIKAASAMEESI